MLSFARQLGALVIAVPFTVGPRSQLGSSVSGELSPIVLPCTQQKPGLIPRAKLSMVHAAMEEKCLEGTLCFLNEFVSCQHHPPKEIICHLIKEMLLDTHKGEILNDIYTLLMKIQMYVFPWSQGWLGVSRGLPSLRVILCGAHPQNRE